MDNGYEIIDKFICEKILNSISAEVNKFPIGRNKGGIRNADKLFKSVNSLARSKPVHNLANQYLPASAKLVRAIIFCKTAKNNWLVPWHQDKTVAVTRKFQNSSWLAWSFKDNIHHVQPPATIMEEMITIRINLDDTNKQNGCLKVVPKSHMLGILNQKSIDKIANNYSSVYCETKKGSALIMRPLILHSSEKAPIPNQRRVLHLEYSSYRLPIGIAWG